MDTIECLIAINIGNAMTVIHTTRSIMETMTTENPMHPFLAQILNDNQRYVRDQEWTLSLYQQDRDDRNA